MRPFRAIRKSQLSPQRRWLVEEMQAMGYGRIKHLVLVDGQPVMDPPPGIFHDQRLTGPNHRRSERMLGDFSLKEQVVKLFEELDRIRNGVIARLEVRDGLPYGTSMARAVRA